MLHGKFDVRSDGIQPKELEAIASDRSHWRPLTHTSSTRFEDDRRHLVPHLF